MVFDGITVHICFQRVQHRKTIGIYIFIFHLMVWCVVSLNIWTSCVVFWRARRASQNINNARESRSRKHHSKCQRIVLHETLRYQTLSSNSINLIADTAELCISSKRSNSVSRNETDWYTSQEEVFFRKQLSCSQIKRTTSSLSVLGQDGRKLMFPSISLYWQWTWLITSFFTGKSKPELIRS